MFLRCIGAASTLVLAAVAPGLRAQNHPPATPTITEPQPATVVNPYDLHMETAAFADADAGDAHVATDWEVWTVSPSELAWRATAVTAAERTHTHLGDGSFVGSHSGWTRLFGSTQYELRVRHRDSSGAAATEWSAWATRPFVTTAASQALPLTLDDVQASPGPRWTDAAGAPVDLPWSALPTWLEFRTDLGQLLLRIEAAPQPGNAVTDPAALTEHRPVRLVIHAGSTGANLVLPPTDLAFAEHGCEVATVRLPALNLAAQQELVLWVSGDGATYIGSLQQTAPTFTTPARSLEPPFVVREPGYTVEVVATGLTLPVNIAFVPVPGSAPGDPKFYVTELHGAVKAITRNGTVLTYAANLLDYTPSSMFPGSGEQGLSGLAVEPATGDLFVALLHNSGTETTPRIVRLHSNDGGRTAATQQVILDMPNEPQGQSHMISRLEIVSGVLFCHMGDGFATATARSLDSYRGKILRLNLDGSPRPDNPFYDGGAPDPRDYIFALGVRNPFGGAWRAADGQRYMVENGPSVDRFAKLVIGRDYLWAGADSHMRNFALHNWSPAVGPVNLAFVQPETFGGSLFPADKMDHAFVTESGPTYSNAQQPNGKRITEWVLDGNGNRLSGPIPFVDYVGVGRGTVAGLAAGPDGLYFSELYCDLCPYGATRPGARILRVRHGSITDCDGNGHADWCEIAGGAAADCNGNQVIDACDLRDGTSHDYDGNAIPDECDRLAASTDRVSAAAGGRIDFALHAGAAHGGQLYALVGSLSGTLPGQQFGNVLLPLNNDFWFGAMLALANTPMFVNTINLLDPAGNASAAIIVPANVDPVLVGLTAHHAYVAMDLGALQFALASNAVPLHVGP